MVFVGDGFIRPEVASFCVNGRYPSRIVERAYLGTDKSVPYVKAVKRGFNGFSRIYADWLVGICVNP